MNPRRAPETESDPESESDFRLPPGFETVVLDDGNRFHLGRLPEPLVPEPESEAFEALWNLHPPEFHAIHIHGRTVPLPRWQAAYGADYHFSGQTRRAEPVPPLLEPVRDWARAAIHPALDGLLLNWYDAARKHRIGPHRDSVVRMVPGAPIVTVSLGSPRTFRLQRRVEDRIQKHDFPTANGTVFILPRPANDAWKHAVPHRAADAGRRISVTLRAFLPNAPAR